MTEQYTAEYNMKIVSWANHNLYHLLRTDNVAITLTCWFIIICLVQRIKKF